MSTKSRGVSRAALVGGLVVPMAALAVFGLAQDRNGPPQGNEPASRVYKNIKVLKDVPAREVIPIMHKINDSLGVRCDFCHVITADHKGFEKDDKKMKNVAREMITMTGDINKRYRVADKKVTCFTCHHGHAEPERSPEGRGEGRERERGR